MKATLKILSSVLLARGLKSTCIFAFSFCCSDEDFEDFHLLCDEFIDNGRAVKGGSRLAAELDSWLLAQPHGEDVSWRGSPKLQRQWSDPSSEAELKTNLAMAVSGSQRTERSQLYWMKR